jgi:hypothetical protein
MSNETHWVSFNDRKLCLEIVYSGDNFDVADVLFKLVSNRYGVLQESGRIPVKALFEIVSLIEVSIKERTQRLENELIRMKKERQNGKED